MCTFISSPSTSLTASFFFFFLPSLLPFLFLYLSLLCLGLLQYSRSSTATGCWCPRDLRTLTSLPSHPLRDSSRASLDILLGACLGILLGILLEGHGERDGDEDEDEDEISPSYVAVCHCPCMGVDNNPISRLLSSLLLSSLLTIVIVQNLFWRSFTKYELWMTISKICTTRPFDIKEKIEGSFYFFSSSNIWNFYTKVSFF